MVEERVKRLSKVGMVVYTYIYIYIMRPENPSEDYVPQEDKPLTKTNRNALMRGPPKFHW